jgi:hypothetical protein
MMEERVVYSDPEEGAIPTWREFLRLSIPEKDMKAEEWEQPISPVNLVAHIDDGQVIEHRVEEVAEAKVETAAVEKAETEAVELLQAAEKAAATTTPETIDMQAGANGLFVMGGSNEEPSDPDGAEDEPITSSDPQLFGSEVPLQPHIQQQQQQFAAAAASANPAPQQTPTTYPDNGLRPEVMQEAMKHIYLRLYHAVFTKCGWQQNPQTGRFYFANPNGILDGVAIGDIIKHYGAHNLVMEYDTLNNMGQGPVAESAENGVVRGTIFKNSGLPGFDLYLNIAGRRIKRRFVPQNPEKRNAQNAYSKTAEEAQQGHIIAWIIDGDAKNTVAFNEKFKVKIRDNVYEVL